MNKKRLVNFMVIGAIVLIWSQLGYCMGRKPSKSVQEDASSVTVIEGTSQQQLPSDTSLQPEKSATSLDIQATQTVTILPAEPVVGLAQNKVTRTRQIQTALKNAGYDPGSVDGKMGVKTMSAIKEFQKANNLVADGKVGPKTWEVLGKFYAGE